MKSIIGICEKTYPSIYKTNAYLKIRLRGEGSGYKEGSRNTGQDPLIFYLNVFYRIKWTIAFMCEFAI